MTPITTVESSWDMPPNDQDSVPGSEVEKQVAIQRYELTQQMVPHVQEKDHSESAGNDLGRDTLEFPAGKVSSPSLLSHVLHHEVPTPDKDPIGQQKEAAPHRIEPPDTGLEHDFSLQQTPSELDVSLQPVTRIQTNEGTSLQTEGAEGTSNLEVQEVEQLSEPEIQRPASVSILPPIAGTSDASHINETVQHQPSSNDSVSCGEKAEGLPPTTATLESMSSVCASLWDNNYQLLTAPHGS